MRQNWLDILAGTFGGLLLFLFHTVVAIGQGPWIHHFRLIDATTGINGYVQKNVIQIVKDLDPAGAVSFNQDLFKVKLDPAINDEELLNLLNGSGLGTFELLDHRAVMSKIGTLPTSDEHSIAEHLELMRLFSPDSYVQYMDSMRRALPPDK